MTRKYNASSSCYVETRVLPCPWCSCTQPITLNGQPAYDSCNRAHQLVLEFTTSYPLFVLRHILLLLSFLFASTFLPLFQVDSIGPELFVFPLCILCHPAQFIRKYCLLRRILVQTCTFTSLPAVNSRPAAGCAATALRLPLSL